MDNYVIYHSHTMLSNGVTNIDSITKYKEYIIAAKSSGMTSIAYSEHGSVFEWVHKKQDTEKAGLKYIHAEEFYVTETLDEKIRDNYHIILIAKNIEGVRELNRLSSKAFNRDNGSFYYVPRITIDDVLGTSNNIIITTACLGGILHNGNNEVKNKFLRFLIDNKHRCYLEIQHHNDEKQIVYNRNLVVISDKYEIPLIAGTDTHSLDDIHHSGRSILQKAKGIRFDSEDTWDLTFKTLDQLVDCYNKQNSVSTEYYLEAINNTNKMSDQIDIFELDYSKKYPKLYDDSLAVLKEKIIHGIKEKGIDKYPNYKDYKAKIEYELKTYLHNEAIDFILLEEDYKSALKKQDIDFGYSRGSVSGSEIAYILGITDVDSIKFNLNFERFMNCERVSLADVDTDWYKDDRGKVRDYLFKKDGLYCCDIITFNTIAMKGAIKDVGRALGMPIDETQKLSDAVEQDENKNWIIADSYRKKYEELFKYVDIVTGTIVSVGNHPAGLIVSPHTVEDAFGIFYSSTDANPISQINMKEVDSLNYVKLDVLGLDCVGLINKTCKLAGIPRLTPDNMDFKDKKIWDDLAEDCTLIFQFESDFAGSYLKDILRKETINNIKKVNPNFSYIDLMSMANGAIRPAGSSYRMELSQGICRDNGHEALNKFLAPTLGFLVYQEQVMEFLHLFCGYTMGEADIVRRGFAKKTGTEKFIPTIKDGFKKTMYEKYGVEKEESDKLIENFLQVIIDASLYLFSKNHADPYSYLGFACAYLRHYYPLEFFTSALDIYKDDTEKITKIKNYIKKQNIEIKQIQFGKSLSDYNMDKESNTIYQGLSSIKYCNSQIADELMDLSKSKKYITFIELISDIKSKTSLNSRQLTILTGLNFFKEFGENKYLLNVIDVYDKFSTCKQINKNKLDELGISEYLIKKFSGKETNSLYKEIDNIGLISELCSKLENKPMGIIESVKFEKEYLEYVTYVNPVANEDYYIITDYTTYKDVTKPYFTARNIKTGIETKSRIKQSKIFKEHPFGLYSVLLITEFDKGFKKKNVNGEWASSDEIEDILSSYEVIK